MVTWYSLCHMTAGSSHGKVRAVVIIDFLPEMASDIRPVTKSFWTDTISPHSSRFAVTHDDKHVGECILSIVMILTTSADFRSDNTRQHSILHYNPISTLAYSAKSENENAVYCPCEQISQWYHFFARYLMVFDNVNKRKLTICVHRLID